MELNAYDMTRPGIAAKVTHRGTPVRVRPGSALWSSLAVLVGGLLSCIAQTNLDPSIVRQPVGGLAAVGESFGFEVQAGGTEPFAYQWYFNSTVLTNATNVSLTLNGLTTNQTGNYQVIVSNSLGRATSSVIGFVVVTNSPRLVTFKDVSAPDASSVRVPLFLVGNGREASVRLALLFSTNAFRHPVFQPENPAWSVSTSEQHLPGTTNNGGQFSLEIAQPPPGMFGASNQPLGYVTFERLGTNTLFTGYLNLTNTAATDTNGLEMRLEPSIVPQADIVDSTPWLNLQTGLFRQRVNVGNPTSLSFTNLELLTYSTGDSASTQKVSHYNAHGTFVSDVNGDGTNDLTTYVAVGPIGPGTVRTFTMEFLVPDHRSVPELAYLIGLSPGRSPPSLPVGLSVVPITATSFTTNGFLIEFPSRVGYSYYVLYSSNVLDLTNSATVQRAYPVVDGIDSYRQWIDVGPPRTATPINEGARYYIVVEAQ